MAEIVGVSLVSLEAEGQRYALKSEGHEFLGTYREYSRWSSTVEDHLSRVETEKRVLGELCSSD